jgi:hypothetical protein
MQPGGSARDAVAAAPSDPCRDCVQVETGSAITWKYPSVVLKGDNTVGEFYSVALTNNMQQADTGQPRSSGTHLLMMPLDARTLACRSAAFYHGIGLGLARMLARPVATLARVQCSYAWRYSISKAGSISTSSFTISIACSWNAVQSAMQLLLPALGHALPTCR